MFLVPADVSPTQKDVGDNIADENVVGETCRSDFITDIVNKCEQYIIQSTTDKKAIYY